MKQKMSITLIIVLTIFLITFVSTIIFFYIFYSNNMKTIENFEEDITLGVQGLAESNIANQITDLKIISNIVRNNSDLIDGIIQSEYNLSYIGEVGNDIFIGLNVDILQIADKNNRVIYSGYDPNYIGTIQYYLGLNDALKGQDVLLANDEVFGWSIKSIVPIKFENKIIATLTIGELIDNNFASEISSILGGIIEVTFALPDNIIGSSFDYNSNYLIDNDLLQDAFFQKRTIREQHLDSEYVAYYKPLRIIDHTIGIIVYVDISDTALIFEQSITNQFVLLMVVYIGALFAGICVSIYITRPLKKLQIKAEKITKDMTGKTFKISGGNEIYRLTNAFNIMTSSLQNSNDELKNSSAELLSMNEELIATEEKLKELNEGLEKIVAERTEKVERLLKQKDEFVNQLGHDLKNPLNPITNLLNIVSQKEEDPELKNLLIIINRNASYMKNLVIKTIDLARLNAPSTKLSIENTNLFNEVQYIIDKNEHLINENKMNIICNIPEDLFIDGDKLRLQELFDNLIVNAIKYSPNGKNIIIDGKKDNDYVIVSIKDEGDGLTKEQIKFVFDEFYKTDNSRHDFNSSGLGLSICKRIVEKHGGEIWVESLGLKKGSTFYFRLPVSSKNMINNSEEYNDIIVERKEF